MIHIFDTKIEKISLIICAVLAIAVLTVMWIFTPKEDTRAVYYPTVSIAIERDGKYKRVEDYLGGYCYKHPESGEIKNRDMHILSPANGIFARATDPVLAEGKVKIVRFSVFFDKPLSGVQVLRWPVTSFGLTEALDSAERITYTNYNDIYYFEIEGGYVYSVYITWGEYFVEYSFITE